MAPALLHTTQDADRLLVGADAPQLGIRRLLRADLPPLWEAYGYWSGYAADGAIVVDIVHS